MKIAIISFNLFTAGGARLTFNMAESLQKLGQQVVIYTPALEANDFGDLVKGLDIRVVPTGRKITYFSDKKPAGIWEWVSQKIRHEQEFVVVSRAIARAMDADIDAVNVQDSAYRVGYFYKKRNPAARVVWTVNGAPFKYLSRGHWLRDMLGYGYQYFRQMTSRKFMKAMDDSAVLANADVHWLDDFPVKHVSVVRAGLDFQKFYAPVKDISMTSRQKKIELLALGALNAFRRYDNVLEAVKLLRDWGYEPHLTLIANNIWNENACRDSLIAYVTSNHLEKNTNLRFDGVPEADLARAYQACDIFVQAVYVPPPGHHGWGLVNFEAMAAGLAAVICRTSTATEVLHDGEDVLLVDPLAPQQIAEKIKFCVDRPDQYRKIAEAGQNVARNMRWEKYAEGMLQLFQK